MNTALVISQIFFNFSVALAIIAFGMICCVVVYHLINIVKGLEKLSQNINHASTKVAKRVNDIIKTLTSLTS